MGDNRKACAKLSAQLKKDKKKNNHLLGTPEDKTKSWFFKIGNEWARHYTDEDMEDLANELIKWSNEEDSLHLGGFTKRYNRTIEWLFNIGQTYSVVGEALRIVKATLSHKYSDGSVKSTYYWAAARSYGISHDPVLKQNLKWLEAIKQDQGVKQENSTIIKEFNEFLEWKANKIRESQGNKETKQVIDIEDSDA